MEITSDSCYICSLCEAGILKAQIEQSTAISFVRLSEYGDSVEDRNIEVIIYAHSDCLPDTMKAKVGRQLLYCEPIIEN